LILNRSGKSIFGKVDEVVTKEHMEEAFGVKVLINEIEEEGHRFKSVTALALT
jgi:iron complex transport system ATP-binding protein